MTGSFADNFPVAFTEHSLEAGKQVIISEGGAEATVAREKLDRLNKQWDTVLAKTRDRQLYLEDSLREVGSLLELGQQTDFFNIAL